MKQTADFNLVLPGQEAAPLEPRRSGRSRKTPQPEELLPQRSSRRTPAPQVPLPQRSTRRTPTNHVITVPQPSTTHAPAIDPLRSPTRLTSGAPTTETTGKRKRPTGEATFNVPDSPPLSPQHADSAVNAENTQPGKRSRIDEAADNGIGDAYTAEAELGLASVLESMEANGEALQKSKGKKRKKRKSIGQQATRRNKAKVSPDHKQVSKGVKPEPLSSPVQGEGSSGLLEVPEEVEDPAEAQIRQELAGAAEEGLRGSSVGDIETDAIIGTLNTSRMSHLQRSSEKKMKETKAMASRSLLEGGESETDPHIFSLPESTSLDGREEDLIGAEERDREGDGGDLEGEDVEDKGHKTRRAPTAKMLLSPAKPKRKKRKSIGQQRPKRASTAAAGKAGKNVSPIHVPKQSKSQPKPPPSASTLKRRQTPSKPINASKGREPPANSVPITMYRPSAHFDEAEDQKENSSSDQDPLTAPLPPPPNTLNAIDVLSQVTREVVAKTASNPQFSSRSQKTMELYGEELEERMKQLGQAFATSTALGKRVRSVKAEEKATRKEVEEVVSERQGVRERIEETTGLKKGMRLGILLGEIAEWAKKGWAREESVRGKLMDGS